MPWPLYLVWLGLFFVSAFVLASVTTDDETTPLTEFLAVAGFFILLLSFLAYFIKLAVDLFS